MTADNPYAAPKAEITECEAPGGRPAWVWVIVIVQITAVLLALLSFAVVFWGVVALPEAQRQRFASLTFVDYLLTAAVTGTQLAAAVFLFRLRKISAYLFPAALVLSLSITAWRAASRADWYAGVGSTTLQVSLVKWSISLIVCLYVWKLAQKGVLR